MAEQTKAIGWKLEGGVTIIRFMDETVLGPAGQHATEELKRLALKVGGKMLLSLANVKFLSSTGIAAIVTFHKLLKARGGALKICDVQPMIMKIFTAAALGKVFDIHKTKAEALAAFNLGETEAQKEGDPDKGES